MVVLKDIQGNLFSCRFFTPNTIVLNHTLKIQYAILHIQYFIFTVSLPELCKGGIICIGKKHSTHEIWSVDFQENQNHDMAKLEKLCFDLLN